ncbi:ion transporter, partial [Nonomuraea angiospora]
MGWSGQERVRVVLESKLVQRAVIAVIVVNAITIGCETSAAIVAIALVPASGPTSVLRSLRILRALRLVSAVPSMRRVVGALLTAMPGMASIIGLLVLMIYIAAVISTKL